MMSIPGDSKSATRLSWRGAVGRRLAQDLSAALTLPGEPAVETAPLPDARGTMGPATVLVSVTVSLLARAILAPWLDRFGAWVRSQFGAERRRDDDVTVHVSV